MTSFDIGTRIISRYMDTNGDGSGTKSATGDYSVTAGYFKIQPPRNALYAITRLIVFVEDGGPTLSADEYGGLAALTNGIRVEVRDNTTDVKNDLTDGVTIKSNAAWSRVCYDATPSNYGSGNVFLSVRWTFERSGGPIYLEGRNAERLVVKLTDSFTGLVDHTFLAQGYEDLTWSVQLPSDLATVDEDAVS